MGVVNIGLKQVCYYDSMSASAGQIAFFGETMLRWVKDEHQNKKGAPLPDENMWKVVHPEHVPQQKNGFDCGVFMVTVAEYLSRRVELTFTQEDIEDRRLQMALQCKRAKV